MIMTYSIKDLKNLVNSEEFKTSYEKEVRLIKLGEKIYGRRKDLVFTQSELAELAGIPQNKISQLESGTYWEPGRDILERLSVALGINIDYFLLDDIDRKTFEIYAYFIPKIKLDPIRRWQLIKIPYFIDLEAFSRFWQKITNYRYFRYYYGPFDYKLYSYEKTLFEIEDIIASIRYSLLTSDEISVIDRVLKEKPVNDGDALKKLSYDTYPMKNLWATIWGREWWREELVF